MLHVHCRRPPAGRCYQGRSSRAALKAAHVFLIFRDPFLNLILGEESGLGESRPLGSKTLHQEEQQLALLSLRKSLSRSLDLEEGGHTCNPYSGFVGKSSRASIKLTGYSEPFHPSAFMLYLSPITYYPLPITAFPQPSTLD